MNVFFFLIIKSALYVLFLNSDIHLVKIPEALIIIPIYLNSWTISEKGKRKIQGVPQSQAAAHPDTKS